MNNYSNYRDNATKLSKIATVHSSLVLESIVALWSPGLNNTHTDWRVSCPLVTWSVLNRYTQIGKYFDPLVTWSVLTAHTQIGEYLGPLVTWSVLNNTHRLANISVLWSPGQF